MQKDLHKTMTEHTKPLKAKNLIDLAGSERVKKSGAAGCCLRSNILLILEQHWVGRENERDARVSVKVFDMQSEGRGFCFSNFEDSQKATSIIISFILKDLKDWWTLSRNAHEIERNDCILSDPHLNHQ